MKSYLRISLPICLLISMAAVSDNGTYRDGTYTGTSRSVYTYEEYYGHSVLTIADGRIKSIRFYIRDSVNHEYFNAAYEKHFTGNDEYIQQCRNDWKGVISYPDSLLKFQDPEKVDAMTGATWSYSIFKASVNEALKKAGTGK